MFFVLFPGLRLLFGRSTRIEFGVARDVVVIDFSFVYPCSSQCLELVWLHVVYTVIYEFLVSPFGG